MDAPSAPLFLSIFKVFQQLSGTYIQESRAQSTELKSYVKLNLNVFLTTDCTDDADFFGQRTFGAARAIKLA